MNERALCPIAHERLRELGLELTLRLATFAACAWADALSLTSPGPRRTTVSIRLSFFIELR